MAQFIQEDLLGISVGRDVVNGQHEPVPRRPPLEKPNPDRRFVGERERPPEEFGRLLACVPVVRCRFGMDLDRTWLPDPAYGPEP